MEVTINGFPKSGNHALWKACCLLGIPTDGVHHIAYSERAQIKGKHILIKRDPRNVVVSMLRMRRMPVTPGTFLTLFRQFERFSLVHDMATYEPWLSDSDTLLVSFEDLISSDATMRLIADYCASPYIDNAWIELPGMTPTWNGKYSDFRDIWTQQVRDAWESEGGNELLSRWGYQPVAQAGL